MKIKTIVRWTFLPVLAVLFWVLSQSFSRAGNTMQLSYDVTTTTFTSLLNIQDSSKLTTFEKINTMAFKDQVRNVATLDPGGDFTIVISRLARPSLGGKPLPLDDISEVTVNRGGITTNGETSPFEPGEYENMTATAKALAGFTTNCASRASDITALATQLINAGAVQSPLNGVTVFRLGNVETVLDLKNYLYIAEWTRQNGRLVREVHYDYDVVPGSNGGGDGGGTDNIDACPVLKRITVREEIKSAANAPLLQVEIHDISNISVVNR